LLGWRRFIGEFCENYHRSLCRNTRQCAHCQTINSPVANYCVVCGHSFTGEAEDEEEKIQNFMLKNPQALKEYVDRLVKQSMETAQ